MKVKDHDCITGKKTYNLSQECIAIVPDLLKKKGFFTMNIGAAFKNLMKIFLSKRNFIIH